MSYGVQNVLNASYVYQNIQQTRYSTMKPYLSPVSNNYYKDTISTQDRTFLNQMSTSMSALYSSGHQLNKIEHSESMKPEDVKKHTEDFIKNYNSAIDTLADKKNPNSTIERLHASLVSVGETNKHSLDAIGIQVGQDGKLTLNEEKFNKSMETNMDQVKDVLGTVGDKAKAAAMRGLNTSTKDLLKDSNNKLQNMMTDETYQAGIRYMASNRQFMSFYYSAEAMLNMYI